MYCPNCAAEHVYGLRYCKQCGTNLLDGPQPAPPAPPAPKTIAAAWPLALATVAITLGGLGIVFTHAFDLMRMFPGEVRTGEATPVAIVMLVFGTLTICGVVAMMMRLFTHLLVPGARAAKGDKAISAAPPLIQLPGAPSSVGSVTEHTTRNFEPGVYDRVRARE
ncbi:MAG TPA: hypothetical protein VKA60_02015 [Blastocatellia bacterium]|nr:hypothetical protein [Blastocatellia bacterium]